MTSSSGYSVVVHARIVERGAAAIAWGYDDRSAAAKVLVQELAVSPYPKSLFQARRAVWI